MPCRRLRLKRRAEAKGFATRISPHEHRGGPALIRRGQPTGAWMARISEDSCLFVFIRDYSFGSMREFLEFVIRQLIEFPDDMVLTEIPNGRTRIFKLQLCAGAGVRVLGRGGEGIQAIRALLASSAARHGQRAVL